MVQNTPQEGLVNIIGHVFGDAARETAEQIVRKPEYANLTVLSHDTRAQITTLTVKAHGGLPNTTPAPR